MKLGRLKIVHLTIFTCLIHFVNCMSKAEIAQLGNEVKEMFYHGYNSYMNYAYPADELMPLSCKGRYRDISVNRGDIDDALGNFSLTLVDTLDSLVIFNNLTEFERAVRLLSNELTFDTDVVVSVFETNIRVLGGLLSGHVFSKHIKSKYKNYLQWYKDELLNLAKDLGHRLLPAFNTSTGIPHPRINLKFGMNSRKIINVQETCTSCAGTMILEFAALSRFTKDPVFEIAARKAMDYLWGQRHRSSDLVGTILNIHNGDWVRRDSGVGAGIDSYYEYLLKGYILLGDENYLRRFNLHYRGIKKYISKGPFLVDVHMHRPHSNSKNFMDSLLAFWPGLQVLKGDLKPAIATHEMLYHVIKKNNNLMPEAFSINNFEPHWSQHFLRPEFIESTYFLYKATSDPYYLNVGKQAMMALKELTRTDCGYAAVKDVRTAVKEDRMDSFFLTETLKYLFLLFASEDDLIIDLDQFIFTTEAHLLPLSLSSMPLKEVVVKPDTSFKLFENSNFQNYRSCPNLKFNFDLNNNWDYVRNIRDNLKLLLMSSFKDSSEKSSPSPSSPARILSPKDFQVTNRKHIELIRKMGITIDLSADGKLQLIKHSVAMAESPEYAGEGVWFMQEVLRLPKELLKQADSLYNLVSITFPNKKEKMTFKAGLAYFGSQLKKPLYGSGRIVEPFKACEEPTGLSKTLLGQIAIVERGDCTFVHKARVVQKLGAQACIVVDDVVGTSEETLPMLTMSGDDKGEVFIPVVFLYHKEGQILINSLKKHSDLVIELRARDDPGRSGKVEDNEAERSKEQISKDFDNVEKIAEECQKKYEHFKNLILKGVKILNAFLENSLEMIRMICNKSKRIIEEALSGAIYQLDRASFGNHMDKMRAFVGSAQGFFRQHLFFNI